MEKNFIPLTSISNLTFHNDKTLLELSCVSKLWRKALQLLLQLRSDDIKRIFKTLYPISKHSHILLFLYPYDLCFRNPRLHMYYCSSTWHIRKYNPEHITIYNGTDIFDPIYNVVLEEIQLQKYVFFHVYIIHMNSKIKFLYFKARIRHGSIGVLRYTNHMQYQQEFDKSIS
jgi:hypothetical protein